MTDPLDPIPVLISSLVAAYDAAHLSCASGLRPPAAPAAVRSLFETLALPIAEQLSAIWSVYGGQDYVPPGTTGLFGRHKLLSPDEALSQHRLLKDNWLSAFGAIPEYPPAAGSPGGWVPQLVPFASWDAYDLCVDASTGEVWEFEPYSGLTKHFASIREFLNLLLSQAPFEHDNFDVGTYRT